MAQRVSMGVSESEESSLLLDEKLLRFMEQLELLEEKRATFNSLIEQVPVVSLLINSQHQTFKFNFCSLRMCR